MKTENEGFRGKSLLYMGFQGPGKNIYKRSPALTMYWLNIYAKFFEATRSYDWKESFNAQAHSTLKMVGKYRAGLKDSINKTMHKIILKEGWYIHILEKTSLLHEAKLINYMDNKIYLVRTSVTICWPNTLSSRLFLRPSISFFKYGSYG